MDNTVNGGVLLEDLVESGLVRDIGLVKLGALAADEFNAVKSYLGGVVEVIDNHHIIAVLEERQGGEGADIAGTTALPQSALEVYTKSVRSLSKRLRNPVPVEHAVVTANNRPRRAAGREKRAKLTR